MCKEESDKRNNLPDIEILNSFIFVLSQNFFLTKQWVIYSQEMKNIKILEESKNYIFKE